MCTMECERARVKIIGRVAIIETERGSRAMIGVHLLCDLAKRLKLCLENYECYDVLTVSSKKQ